MRFTIEYHEKVVKEDIPKLSSKERERIKTAIETKLGERPEIFGKPLRKSLKGYRKLRVGEYRIVFLLKKKRIRILVIAHRSEVYEQANKRMQ